MEAGMKAWLKYAGYLGELARLLALAEASPSKRVITEIKFDPDFKRFSFRALAPVDEE
jgi:hypothetical protein